MSDDPIRPGSPVLASPRSSEPKEPTPLATRGEAAIPGSLGGLARLGLLWRSCGGPGATDTFAGSGKYVAAASWVRALAEYAALPHVDVFAPAEQIQAGARQLLGLRAQEPAGVVFWRETEIPARFRAHGYDALHSPDGVDLARLSYVRSRLSRRVFPVTGAQTGISYSTDLLPCWIALLSARIYPCDAIVCSTEASRRAMEKKLADIAERYSEAWGRPAPLLPRLELIPWGIDTRRFSPRDPAPARRDLDLPPDQPIVLCLGRVRIQNKMDWTPLLLAFDRVRRMAKKRPLLVLAGAASGQYDRYLLSQAAQLGLGDHVRTFFGVPPACLPSLYAACDIFVSPVDSPQESFGLTVAEAMACGRPVVASDWDGYMDLIVHGETGFKVRTDWADCLAELDEAAPFLEPDLEHLHVGQSVSVDVAQLAHYVVQLLNNQELRWDIGRRARERAEALYDWQVVIEQWEAMWGELSAIASSLKPLPDCMEYLRPHYFQHFCHYTSRLIHDGVQVRLTDRGKEVLAGRAPLLLHPQAQGVLQPQFLVACLSGLRPAGWVGTGLPVGRVVEILHKAQGLTRDEALLHLMWLAKYDLVSLDGDQNCASGVADP